MLCGWPDRTCLCEGTASRGERLLDSKTIRIFATDEVTLMAYYDALVAVWTTGKPANVTGATFSAGSPAATKLAAINGWIVAKGSPDKALLNPSDILNAIVFADLAALTQLQVTQLGTLLSGTQVDA